MSASDSPHPAPAAYIAWLLVCLIWGTTYLAIRLAIDTIPPLLMAASRWIAAGALLSALLRLRGEPLPARSSWTALLILGVLLIGFGNGAVVLAEQAVPSGLTAVLIAVTPFWMIGIQRFTPGAPPLRASHVAGLALGFSGVLFLVWPNLQRGSGARFLAGVAAIQIACLGWAAGSNYARVRNREGSVLGETAFQMMFGGAFLLVAALVRGERIAGAISATSLTALIYLALVGSVVGFSAYAYALSHLPLSLVSLYAYINPIIAVVLGTIVLGEPMTARLLVASAAVLAGIAIVKR